MKCWYNGCSNDISEEDKWLKKETAKYCEEHNKEFKKLTNGKIGELVKFMLKTKNPGEIK